MASRNSQTLYSIEEYLALERASEERHEYIDGYIYAMAGESGEHGDICTNLVRAVSTQLLGAPCRARSKDTKVLSGPMPIRPRSKQGLFSYPDLVIICGEPQYHDEHTDVILNPPVIIEVLSKSTESWLMSMIASISSHRILRKAAHLRTEQTGPIEYCRRIR